MGTIEHGITTMKNKKLSEARIAKNDEFYTQWADIEKEVLAYLKFDHYQSAVFAFSRIFGMDRGRG